MLIINGILNSHNFDIRKKYQAMIKEMEQDGVEVFIFNEDHVSGQKLKDITGLAAILRYELDLEELEDDS